MSLAVASLRFPKEEILKSYLSGHSLLTIDYYQEEGITPIIIKLATSFFANENFHRDEDFTERVDLVLDHLYKGKYKRNQEKIKQSVRLMPKEHIFTILETALRDCAKYAKA